MELETTLPNEAHHSRDSLDFRRGRAILVDAASTIPADLGAVWRSLACGTLRIADAFTGDERSYLLLAKAEERGRDCLLPPSHQATFESVVTQGAQKVVAAELGCTASTIAMRARAVLAFIGLGCTFSRAPALILLAVYAHRGVTIRLDARVSEMTTADGAWKVLSIPRLDLAVASMLSPGEADVVREWIEGRSHSHVAERRRRSSRTVANQISAATRKLGVSGRLELIRRLASAGESTPDLKISA